MHELELWLITSNSSATVERSAIRQRHTRKNKIWIKKKFVHRMNERWRKWKRNQKWKSRTREQRERQNQMCTQTQQCASISKTNTVDLVKRRGKDVCASICMCACIHVHTEWRERRAQIEHRFWAVEWNVYIEECTCVSCGGYCYCCCRRRFFQYLKLCC